MTENASQSTSAGPSRDESTQARFIRWAETRTELNQRDISLTGHRPYPQEWQASDDEGTALVYEMAEALGWWPPPAWKALTRPEPAATASTDDAGRAHVTAAECEQARRTLADVEAESLADQQASMAPHRRQQRAAARATARREARRILTRCPHEKAKQ